MHITKSTSLVSSLSPLLTGHILQSGFGNGFEPGLTTVLFTQVVGSLWLHISRKTLVLQLPHVLPSSTILSYVLDIQVLHNCLSQQDRKSCLEEEWVIQFDLVFICIETRLTCPCECQNSDIVLFLAVFTASSLLTLVSKDTVLK